MSKTLIVSYIPRGEMSNTKKLVDAFKSSAVGKTEIVERDLVKNPPEMFLGENLMAYVKRNYMGEVSEENDRLLAGMDAIADELMSSDYVVVAFPMYNFGLPAVVKAWLDSVVQAGKTFKMGERGYEGLLSGKALVLSTAGGMGYENGGRLQFADHARPLMVEGLGFMGFEASRVEADGANAMGDKYAELLEKKCAEVREVAEEWYA